MSRTHTLEGGQVIHNVHATFQCVGRHCTIHNMSDHHMRSFPQVWDAQRVMWRRCPHGSLHADPDDPNAELTPCWGGTDQPPPMFCDGCCNPDVYFEKYRDDIAGFIDYRNELREKYED